MPKKTVKTGKKRAKDGVVVDSSAKFEALLKKTAAGARYSLRLFITGTTGRSTEAVANIRQICEDYLPGRYDLEVVDIYQQPGMAGEAQIIAAPTLIKRLPKPIKRLIGNLSDPEKLIVGLDLKEQT